MDERLDKPVNVNKPVPNDHIKCTKCAFFLVDLISKNPWNG